jgi:hypothetical protein
MKLLLLLFPAGIKFIYDILGVYDKVGIIQNRDNELPVYLTQ